MHHPGSPKLKFWDTTMPRALFFLCNHYPKTQRCSLTHWWLDLTFHFLCGVTVGSYFVFSSGDSCSFAVFPSSPFWHFSFLPCDSESECLHSWLFCSIIAALASVWSPGREVQRAGLRCLQPTERLSLVSFVLFKGVIRQVGMKEQLKNLRIFTFWKVLQTSDLFKLKIIMNSL